LNSVSAGKAKTPRKYPISKGMSRTNFSAAEEVSKAAGECSTGGQDVISTVREKSCSSVCVVKISRFTRNDNWSGLNTILLDSPQVSEMFVAKGRRFMRIEFIVFYPKVNPGYSRTTVARAASVREIVGFAVMSDAGVLGVR
jgi:hypothetical protein